MAEPPKSDALGVIGSEGIESAAQPGAPKSRAKKAAAKLQNEEIDDGWDFGDDDASMLDLISSYGQEDIKQKDVVPFKPKGKKK